MITGVLLGMDLKVFYIVKQSQTIARPAVDSPYGVSNTPPPTQSPRRVNSSYFRQRQSSPTNSPFELLLLIELSATA